MRGNPILEDVGYRLGIADRHSVPERAQGQG
jgi:hypothetical protein